MRVAAVPTTITPICLLDKHLRGHLTPHMRAHLRGASTASICESSSAKATREAHKFKQCRSSRHDGGNLSCTLNNVINAT